MGSAYTGGNNDTNIEESTTSWQIVDLQTHPGEYNPQILKITTSSFIQIPYSYHERLSVIDRFDTKGNKWDIWNPLSISLEIEQSAIAMAAFDETNKIMYVQIVDKMIEIDLKNNTTKIAENITNIGYCARALVIDQQLHVIGGEWNNKCHLIWSTAENKYDIMHTFDVAKITSAGMVYIRSKNIILLLGGNVNTGYQEDYDSDEIYSYDMELKKWKELSVKLPMGLSYFGCTLSRNETYVIIFGGTSEYSLRDDIFILEIETMQFKDCKIKCPKRCTYHAIAMGGTDKAVIITSGYIRNVWSMKDFNDRDID